MTKKSYNLDVLCEALQRDNAIIADEYGKVNKRSRISFICNCGQEYNKVCLEIVSRAGAFCKKCTKNNSINKLHKTVNAKCTIKSLNTIIQRDDAQLLIKYNSITQNTNIKFKCNCGKDSEKNCLQLITVSGAFCEGCTRINWTNNIKNTNMERYGVECTAQAPEIKQKIEKSNLENYGVINVFSSSEIQHKIKQTMIHNYGVEHPSQSQKIQERTQKNAKKYKEYKMPSGEIRKIQGYEHFALNELIKSYEESDIITDRKYIPRIGYKIGDKQKYYFPDIYIKSINKIIEVKSVWTYGCKEDNIQEKANATKLKGYNYEIWVYDSKGSKTTK
jgi:hypothetical protein